MDVDQHVCKTTSPKWSRGQKNSHASLWHAPLRPVVPSTQHRQGDLDVSVISQRLISKYKKQTAKMWRDSSGCLRFRLCVVWRLIWWFVLVSFGALRRLPWNFNEKPRFRKAYELFQRSTFFMRTFSFMKTGMKFVNYVQRRQLVRCFITHMSLERETRRPDHQRVSPSLPLCRTCKHIAVRREAHSSDLWIVYVSLEQPVVRKESLCCRRLLTIDLPLEFCLHHPWLVLPWKTNIRMNPVARR